jgi:hypothetical protein
MPHHSAACAPLLPSRFVFTPANISLAFHCAKGTADSVTVSTEVAK